jgi:hypothetical protein
MSDRTIPLLVWKLKESSHLEAVGAENENNIKMDLKGEDKKKLAWFI